MNLWLKSGFYLIFLLAFLPLKAQIYQQKPPSQTRILFLLDGSGSMLAPWGPTNRINAAKKFLKDFVDSLKVNQDLELALRVYGHQYHRRFQRCDDSRLEVSFGRNNHQTIIQKLNQIDPKGTTPIAYSLAQAANDFPSDQDVRNIIIIITDGIESCEGDPCAVSLELQRRGIFLKPFIIGMGMEKNAIDEFGCMGQYYDATNIREFRSALQSAITQTLDKTTVSIELLDQYNQPTISNINVTFINDFTNRPMYEFIHYRDVSGRPDSVEIDAVLSYDIRVNTVPPVLHQNPVIQPGQHNVIQIQCPQGSLQILQKNHSEYTHDVKVLIYEKNTKIIIHTLDIAEKQKYLAGSYDLEITTLPKMEYSGIRIKPDQLVKIELPPPGLLNITRNFNGHGSLYVMLPEGNENWIYDIPEDELITSIAIQPGEYKIVFRINHALGSKFTKVETFKILSGKTVNLQL